MQSITRSKLVARLAARTAALTVQDAEVSVSLILGAITDALARGERVEIRGFGSFASNYRSPRDARNPKTGVSVHVPEKHVPYFKAGKEMRERVDIYLRYSGEGGSSTSSSVASHF